jgi:hypothetical protein
MEGMEGSTMGTELSTRGTPVRKFSCKTHVDMSLCLTEEFLHNMTERASNGSFKYRGTMTLLVVAIVLCIYTQF